MLQILPTFIGTCETVDCMSAAYHKCHIATDQVDEADPQPPSHHLNLPANDELNKHHHQTMYDALVIQQ